MGFTQMRIEDIIDKKREESPEFKKEWDESREEYRLIGEMIQIRKQEKITQSQLAVITGNRQQVLSCIEKRENSPSLKTFFNILEALGYEMQIVKSLKYRSYLIRSLRRRPFTSTHHV